MEKTPDTEKLFSTISNCYAEFKNSTGRMASLKIINDSVKDLLEDNFEINVLYGLDDVSRSFLKLLDQIVFEIGNGYSMNGDGIEEYIIDDLYLRVEMYMDLFNNINLYKKKLRDRPLRADDLIIIRQYRLSEFVPLLMSEFFDQHNMRLDILKTMLFFDEDELLHFYYDIAKNNYYIELRILALMGLKKEKYSFKDWHLLNDRDDEHYDALIEYIKDFKLPGIHGKNRKENIFIYIFRVLFVEISLINGFKFSTYDWLIKLLYDITDFIFHNNIENPFLQQHIYNSIANIFRRLEFNILQKTLKNKDTLKSFLNLLNILPVEMFDVVMILIDRLGEGFLFSVEKLLTSSSFKAADSITNLLGYLFPVDFNKVNI